MSTNFKSRIPKRIKTSKTTALHATKSESCRSRSAAFKYRCSTFRSKLPLPINKLAASVKPVSLEAAVVMKKLETETDVIIRSLVRRSIPPAVRGNRTSFRRIQLAHGSPVASASLIMKPISWRNTSKVIHEPEKQLNQSIPLANHEKLPEAHQVSAKNLLELVAGKRQPDMQLMRFLCSDHRLINVPCHLMYRHSVVMCRLDTLEQPIELRSIRSVTLLRVILWMHEKSLCGNGNRTGTESQRSCICWNDSDVANETGNGSENNENSGKNTYEKETMTEDNDSKRNDNEESINYDRCECESPKDMRETSKNKNTNADSVKTDREITENSQEKPTNPHEKSEIIKNNKYNGLKEGRQENTEDKCVSRGRIEGSDRMSSESDSLLRSQNCYYHNEIEKGMETKEENHENASTESVKYENKTIIANEKAENSWELKQKLKKNAYNENENKIGKYSRSVNSKREYRKENVIKLNASTGNTQRKTKCQTDLNGSGSHKKVAIPNRDRDRKSQDRTVNSAKENGFDKRKKKGLILGEANRNIEENLYIYNEKKQNSSKTHTRKCKSNDEGTGSENESQPFGENSWNFSARSKLYSWEERLLGSELCQLVELILAAHYLGVESLTNHATYHFGKLMAQRTQWERYQMLKIKTHLAGVRQTLDSHRPLITEIMSQTRNIDSVYYGTNIQQQQQQQQQDSNRMSRIRRSRLDLQAPLCPNTPQGHHQHCFRSTL
ncbi:GATA zinc finger domain-containing protein 14 [Drosophila eugracilis]|uniref:GATA zinc finger domain-containing protein 14 n=1 Tax=Drosophila eugracilis TaxID=29029 RepID=UPI0007E732D2|nr:GATA zinc finger domain-containing protein 14 [Drosophila eugracilis]